jgi:glutaredoxin
MMKNITIYSTPTCHFCQLAKEYFKENNISYSEYNVLSDLEKRQEMVAKSGQLGVPVIVFDWEVDVEGKKQKIEKMVVGFDKVEVENILKS